MTKYQLGTGMVNGKETIILLFELKHFNLAEVVHNHSVPQSLMEMMEEWSEWNNKIVQRLEEIESLSLQHIPITEITWLSPLIFPRKLICIGANYKAHSAEMGSSTAAKPLYPYSFFKPATTTLVGSGKTVILPEKAKLIDWEAELAVIIGKKVRNVTGKEAMDSVAGYSILNDVSARDWTQDRPSVGMDWVMHKAFDGFAPMGPYITPAQFVPDPQNLNMKLYVNGDMKQSTNTSDMVFSVQEIIEHLSSIMTLEPGDVIATGTPAGVGHGRKPPEYIQSGDYIKVEIDELGFLESYFK